MELYTCFSYKDHIEVLKISTNLLTNIKFLNWHQQNVRIILTLRGLAKDAVRLLFTRLVMMTTSTCMPQSTVVTRQKIQL